MRKSVKRLFNFLKNTPLAEIIAFALGIIFLLVLFIIFYSSPSPSPNPNFEQSKFLLSFDAWLAMAISYTLTAFALMLYAIGRYVQNIKTNSECPCNIPCPYGILGVIEAMDDSNANKEYRECLENAQYRLLFRR